jgi:hypothetical protein
MGKTNALRNKISSFQQQANESIPDTWEWMQEYDTTYPHYGMKLAFDPKLLQWLSPAG